MKPTWHRCFAAAAAWCVLAAAAQPAEPPAVGAVRLEAVSGGVERPNGQPRQRLLRELPAAAYSHGNGFYDSRTSRIRLKVPRVGDEATVDVRESISLVRADQSPATTHVIFDPGGTRPAWEPTDAVSAVVVTRLRDDRPKDAEAVLQTLDGGALRDMFPRAGINHSRIQTPLGPGLQRLTRNRANTDRFPYELAMLRDQALVTYGATQYIVVGTDSLVEFSQVYACKGHSDADCLAIAVQGIRDFVAGVQEFRPWAEAGNSPAK